MVFVGDISIVFLGLENPLIIGGAPPCTWWSNVCLHLAILSPNCTCIGPKTDSNPFQPVFSYVLPGHFVLNMMDLSLVIITNIPYNIIIFQLYDHHYSEIPTFDISWYLIAKFVSYQNGIALFWSSLSHQPLPFPCFLFPIRPQVICLQEVDETWAGRLHSHFQSHRADLVGGQPWYDNMEVSWNGDTPKSSSWVGWSIV